MSISADDETEIERDLDTLIAIPSKEDQAKNLGKSDVEKFDVVDCGTIEVWHFVTRLFDEIFDLWALYPIFIETRKQACSETRMSFKL